LYQIKLQDAERHKIELEQKLQDFEDEIQRAVVKLCEEETVRIEIEKERDGALVKVSVLERELDDTDRKRKEFEEKLQMIEDLDLDMPGDINIHSSHGHEHVVELGSRFRHQLKILESERS
jgi:hypothetical protein